MAVPAVVGMVGLVLLVVFPRVSPYAQGKLLAMSSPWWCLPGWRASVCLRGRRLRQRSDWPLALRARSLAILASDLLAYNHDRVAPTARMEAIRETGDHFAGRGLVLWNEFEEYAKYFARAAKISVPFEALTPQQVQLRSPTYFYGHYFDLDQELLSFVEKYPIIVTRRSPAASRPPANYRLVYENAYYLGWERMRKARSARTPAAAAALQPDVPGRLHRRLAPIVAKAPHGIKAVVAEAPELSLVRTSIPIQNVRTAGPRIPNQAGSVFTATAGHARRRAHRGKRPGAYRVWVQGDFPRPSAGASGRARQSGPVSGSNTPGQWLQAATLHLSPGKHLVSVEKAAGRDHLGPGEWAVGTFGAVALQSETPERMVTLPLSSWHTLCGKEADWVEVVRRVKCRPWLFRCVTGARCLRVRWQRWPVRASSTSCWCAIRARAMGRWISRETRRSCARDPRVRVQPRRNTQPADAQARGTRGAPHPGRRARGRALARAAARWV